MAKIRKIDRDIEYAEKKYREAKERLQYLYELRDASDFEDEVKPNMRNVVYYAAYYNGVRRACNKILNDYFGCGDPASNLSKKDERASFEAILQLARKSVLDAERWMGEGQRVIFKPIERKKKSVTKYKAYWVDSVTILRPIE